MIRLLFALALALPCFAGTPPDQQVYQDFLNWYRTYTGSFMPPEVTKAYTAVLKDGGIAADEIERRLDIVRRKVAAMPPEFAALHFDNIYRMPKPPFRTDASQFLSRMVEGRKPGRALDVAMGQGRNAIYLAGQGWDVTGYDISTEGLAMARAKAEKAGLKIKTVTASHEEFDYGVAQWDLIVETFAFTNLSDAAYRKRLLDSLKPGGLLVIEGFGGGPKNAMFEDFRDLRIVHYEDRDDVADWGIQKMRLTRLAAQKE